MLWKTEPSAGCWPFPGRKNELAFLAVSAQHRRQGIARKLAERMFRELDPARPVKLITYRAGCRGEAARSLYSGWEFWSGQAVVEVDGSRHRNSCARRKFPVLKGVRQSEIPAFRRPAHRQTP